MPTSKPIDIPFPLSTFPGAMPQESAGRLINCYAEVLGDPLDQSRGAPKRNVWRRSPGLSRHNIAATGQTGYRGGLLVAGSSYETWSGNASTLDVNGNYTSLGTFPGTKPVSIARNQDATPDIVAVDIDNGAYVLSGGGAPSFYNGGGVLPQPNSVCFQDGYLFFTIASGQCYATAINSLTMNALTFATAEAKADVTLLRGIAYSGLLFLFTTGSAEVWQDVANVAPNFPYNRLVVLEYGLIQANAIAGWETGFSELCWVAQDFGVYWMTPGSLAPLKVSSPDLDRLIETQVRLGNQLRAGCYIIAGKKFWTISSPTWTWEINLSTKKWNERWSLNATLGLQSLWRGAGGHPAFGKWLLGDTQSGNLLFVDDQNYTDDGAPQLYRIESGLVGNFPDRQRIARADFEFDAGTGQVTRAISTVVTGAAAGTGGAIELTVADTAQMSTNDYATVASVGGTTEANGTFPITVIDDKHILLQGSAFKNAYTSGGTVTDITAPANVVAPSVAVSWSDDNGNKFGNPLIRALGQQGQSKTTRISVKNTGQTGPDGRRWRLDVSDAVYVGFLGATQSDDPRQF